MISHGKPFPGPFAVLEHSHPEGMRALAALSDNSVLTVAGNSMHAVPLEEPQIVIDAITAVQHAARTGTPLRDAAPCASRARQGRHETAAALRPARLPVTEPARRRDPDCLRGQRRKIMESWPAAENEVP